MSGSQQIFADGRTFDGVSHCPDCGKEVTKLSKSNASAGGIMRFLGPRNVWDCPHCGAILGVSGYT